jgi:hypothetical protein
MFILEITRIHSLAWASPTNKGPGKHPIFIKKIPCRYSSYGMKNKSKGITIFKNNRCLEAYKLKKDKMPVIPFLSLSSGGRTRWPGGKRSA